MRKYVYFSIFHNNNEIYSLLLKIKTSIEKLAIIFIIVILHKLSVSKCTMQTQCTRFVTSKLSYCLLHRPYIENLRWNVEFVVAFEVVPMFRETIYIYIKVNLSALRAKNCLFTISGKLRKLHTHFMLLCGCFDTVHNILNLHVGWFKG